MMRREEAAMSGYSTQRPPFSVPLAVGCDLDRLERRVWNLRLQRPVSSDAEVWDTQAFAQPEPVRAVATPPADAPRLPPGAGTGVISPLPLPARDDAVPLRSRLVARRHHDAAGLHRVRELEAELRRSRDEAMRLRASNLSTARLLHRSTRAEEPPHSQPPPDSRPLSYSAHSTVPRSPPQPESPPPPPRQPARRPDPPVPLVPRLGSPPTPPTTPFVCSPSTPASDAVRLEAELEDARRAADAACARAAEAAESFIAFRQSVAGALRTDECCDDSELLEAAARAAAAAGLRSRVAAAVRVVATSDDGLVGAVEDTALAADAAEARAAAAEADAAALRLQLADAESAGGLREVAAALDADSDDPADLVVRCSALRADRDALQAELSSLRQKAVAQARTLEAVQQLHEERSEGAAGIIRALEARLGRAAAEAEAARQGMRERSERDALLAERVRELERDLRAAEAPRQQLPQLRGLAYLCAATVSHAELTDVNSSTVDPSDRGTLSPRTPHRTAAAAPGSYRLPDTLTQDTAAQAVLATPSVQPRRTGGLRPSIVVTTTQGTSSSPSSPGSAGPRPALPTAQPLPAAPQPSVPQPPQSAAPWPPEEVLALQRLVLTREKEDASARRSAESRRAAAALEAAKAQARADRAAAAAGSDRLNDSRRAAAAARSDAAERAAAALAHAKLEVAAAREREQSAPAAPPTSAAPAPAGPATAAAGLPEVGASALAGAPTASEPPSEVAEAAASRELELDATESQFAQLQQSERAAAPLPSSAAPLPLSAGAAASDGAAAVLPEPPLSEDAEAEAIRALESGEAESRTARLQQSERAAAPLPSPPSDGAAAALPEPPPEAAEAEARRALDSAVAKVRAARQQQSERAAALLSPKGAKPVAAAAVRAEAPPPPEAAEVGARRALEAAVAKAGLARQQQAEQAAALLSPRAAAAAERAEQSSANAAKTLAAAVAAAQSARQEQAERAAAQLSPRSGGSDGAGAGIAAAIAGRPELAAAARAGVGGLAAAIATQPALALPLLAVHDGADSDGAAPRGAADGAASPSFADSSGSATAAAPAPPALSDAGGNAQAAGPTASRSSVADGGAPPARSGVSEEQSHVSDSGAPAARSGAARAEAEDVAEAAATQLGRGAPALDGTCSDVSDVPALTASGSSASAALAEAMAKAAQRREEQSQDAAARLDEAKRRAASPVGPSSPAASAASDALSRAVAAAAATRSTSSERAAAALAEAKRVVAAAGGHEASSPRRLASASEQRRPAPAAPPPTESALGRGFHVLELEAAAEAERRRADELAAALSSVEQQLSRLRRYKDRESRLKAELRGQPEKKNYWLAQLELATLAKSADAAIERLTSGVGGEEADDGEDAPALRAEAAYLHSQLAMRDNEIAQLELRLRDEAVEMDGYHTALAALSEQEGLLRSECAELKRAAAAADPSAAAAEARRSDALEYDALAGAMEAMWSQLQQKSAEMDALQEENAVLAAQLHDAWTGHPNDDDMHALEEAAEAAQQTEARLRQEVDALRADNENLRQRIRP